MCLPLVLKGQAELAGTDIVRIRHPGDFCAKKVPVELIEGIYRNLSQGKAIIPPAVAFVFDRESRSDSAMDEVTRKTNGRVKFLPRRMFENYLLVPEALASVMNQLESFRSPAVTETEVRDWLEANGGKAKYLLAQSTTANVEDKGWLKSVHAAMLLEDLFQDLSSARYTYHKLIHSQLLIQWLLTNKPIALEELKLFFLGLLSASEA